MTTRVPGYGPLPTHSRVMIVSDMPVNDHGRSNHLRDSLLAQAGIGISGCYHTHVCKFEFPGQYPKCLEEVWTDNAAKARRNALPFRHGDHWMHGYVAEGLADLPHEIEAARPEVIVALGNLALWALTGETGIGNWRGSEMWFAGVPVPGPWDWNFKKPKGGEGQAVATGRAGTSTEVAVVPTYHPAYVLRVWEWKPAVTHDLRMRVVGKMGKPEARKEPVYNFTVAHEAGEAKDQLQELGEWLGLNPETPLVCDIETRRGRLVCAGFAWSPTDALCIPFMHVDGTRFWGETDERELAAWCRMLLAGGTWPVGNQNWNYDRQYFMRDPAFGFRPRIDFDTMIAQHLYLPGTPKDLSYLSSLYCAHHRFWKEEGKEVVAKMDEDRFFNYNCLTPDTLVLTEDCQWKQLGDVEIGNKLLSFDEQPTGHRYSRSLRSSTVTKTQAARREVISVAFEDGQKLTGTLDHQVFVQKRWSSGKMCGGQWRELGSLKPGDELISVGAPWVQADDYWSGWLAGIIDGEGSLGVARAFNKKAPRISFAQKEGFVLERAVELLQHHGFKLTQHTTTSCEQIDIRGGLAEELRLLGTFPMMRILAKFIDVARVHGWGGFTMLRRNKVTSVAPLGVKEVVDISTSTHTFIANGMFVHNCLDAVKTWEVWQVQKRLLKEAGLD